MLHKGKTQGKDTTFNTGWNSNQAAHNGYVSHLYMLFPMFHYKSLAGVPQHHKLAEGELQNHSVVELEFYCFAIRFRHVLTQLMRDIFLKNETAHQAGLLCQRPKWATEGRLDGI